MREFEVVLNDCAGVAVPGGPLSLRTRETDIGPRNFDLNFTRVAEGLPRQLEPRELDWLETVGHLFAVDLACKRGEGDVEWARSIRAHLPVRDPDFWNGVASQVQGVFEDFTSDRLELVFVADDTPSDAPRQRADPFPQHDSVALLSGGVDSFVGAFEMLDRGMAPLALSHTAAGSITAAQNKAEERIRTSAPDFERITVTARKHGKDFPTPEPSQRARTMLFLGAAAVIAAVGGSSDVLINENGVMAIHLPLTVARIGSQSTHTAAPRILERLATLATEVLGAEVRIANLLLPLTKPEVVEASLRLGVADHLKDTVSCWSIGRTSRHCGVCSPCLMRRISLERHGVEDVEYHKDAFNDPEILEDAFAADNLSHLVRLVDGIAGSNDLQLQLEFPELLNGGRTMDLAAAIDLHRRWADQASASLYAAPVPTGIR